MIRVGFGDGNYMFCFPVGWENIIVYIYTRGCILEQNFFLGIKYISTRLLLYVVQGSLHDIDQSKDYTIQKLIHVYWELLANESVWLKCP